MVNSGKVMSNIDFDDLTFEVDLAVEQVCGADWAWDHYPEKWGRGPSMLLWLITGGRATLRTSHYGEYQVRRGQFYIMPALASEYHGRHDPNAPLEVIWAFFRVLDPAGQQVRTAPALPGIPFHTPLIDLHFAELLAKRMLAASSPWRARWLQLLLAEVSEQATLGHAAGNERWMHELGQNIQAHPGRYHSLDDMLREYRVTKDHLIRLFRKYHGVTPGEFLIRARLDQARALLAASSLSIKQIAAQLGYADSFTFSRQFKARTGLPPRQFRNFPPRPA